MKMPVEIFFLKKIIIFNIIMVLVVELFTCY